MVQLTQRYLLDRLEGIVLAGLRGEVWIEPGKPPTQVCGSDGELLID